MLIEENGNQKKSYLIVTIPTTDFTQIGLGSNPGLRYEKLANNSPSHGTEGDDNRRMAH
jgi:hypothetical protein